MDGCWRTRWTIPTPTCAPGWAKIKIDFPISVNFDFFSLFYAGTSRLPPRVLTSEPKLYAGNYETKYRASPVRVAKCSVLGSFLQIKGHHMTGYRVPLSKSNKICAIYNLHNLCFYMTGSRKLVTQSSTSWTFVTHRANVARCCSNLLNGIEFDLLLISFNCVQQHQHVKWCIQHSKWHTVKFRK